MVGISKEQAQSYTEWRTDRVSERILIERGLVKMFPQQNAENHFTVERYKNGSFEWIIKKEDVFLPVYRIPTEKEWMKIAAPSYELLKGANKSKYNAKVLKNNGVLFHTAERSTSPKSKGPMPAKHLGKDLNGLFDVIGNVSEMVAEGGISKGGSWKHPLAESAITQQMEFKEPNSWTGLRNVCSWEFVEVKQ